jgi:dolichyl-diphosphooligosaccharide--protein glycosyltransferase
MRGQSFSQLWAQFGGAIVLAAIGFFGLCMRAPAPGHNAILLFALFMLPMSLLHARFNYYLAIGVAALGGFAADWLIGCLPSKAPPVMKWALVGALGLLLLVPNITHALLDPAPATPVTPDWKQALDWLRLHTPEPFGNPAAYYQWNGPRPYAGWQYPYPTSAYSIMGWWDYGYWIEAVARRIPVANGTQRNADLAAEFFLAQSEEEGLRILAQCRSRYIVFDNLLPITGDRFFASGQFVALFEYAKSRRIDDYVVEVWSPTSFGWQPQKYYRPAYYRTLLWRMFVGGGKAVNGVEPAIISFQEVPQAGTTRRVLTRLQPAGDRQDGPDGILVGQDPMTSPVPVEGLSSLQQEFLSPRQEVRIYSVPGAS